MSLLLDALKKAADDKKNLALDEPAENTDNVDDSLELELDLDSNTEVVPGNDDFPEVDESSISQSIMRDTIDQQAPADSSLQNEPSDIPDNVAAENSVQEKFIEPVAVNLEETGTEDDNATITVPPAKPATSSAKNTDNASINTKTITDDKLSIAPKPAVAESVQNSTKNIATETALLALINKSNQYSKRENLKKNITIAILVTLLLIGSGLFFYIKMDTANQGIFIAQNNQAPVNRSLDSREQNTQAILPKAENIITKPAVAKKTTLKKKPPPTNTNTNKNSKSIQIFHSEKKDPINTLILEAYNQFQRGDYEQANNLYNQVILREPNNRDALLGLSAIATKQQRYEFARQKYQYLLHLNPKDSIAIAGISSIENAIDTQLNESQLKFMLKGKPDTAHLYFALGSLYSSQNKWPEAQSAYFSAWSAENKNADYAYNLAISLDHLDKKSQALDFYTLSLKLKQASSGNFSTENTSQRIRTLKESNNVICRHPEGNR